MFGSDWPVCNVGGPRGEEGNWAFWREVVLAVVEGWGGKGGEEGEGEGESERVWWRAAAEAYRVDV